MGNKRMVAYQIHSFNPPTITTGQIQVLKNQPLPLILQKIEKQAGYFNNSLVLQQPQPHELDSQTKFIKLKSMQWKEQGERVMEQGGGGLEDSSLVEPDAINKYIFHVPEIPPKIIGEVRKCSRVCLCITTKKIMVLTYTTLKLSNPNKSLENPQQIINVSTIKQISTYRKKNIFFIRILLNNNHRMDFLFHSKDICKQWFKYMNKIIDYYQYLSQIKSYYSKNQYETLIKNVEEENDKKVVKLDDDDSNNNYLKQNDSQSMITQNHTICQKNTISTTNLKNTVRLADFSIIQQIGQGAYGTVYQAQKNGKMFALKQINKDHLMNKNQIKYAFAQLDILKKYHKQCNFIIPLYYAFQTEDNLYLALKYLPFGTLQHLVENNKKLTKMQAFNILCQLILVIQFLHKNNILYRDMKPQNILMTEEGHIYLIDFGLSIQLKQQEQFALSFVGNPLFLAPERLQGNGSINYKADIFGVGCIYYFMLHGFAPFQSKTINEILFKIRNNSQIIFSDDIDHLSLDFLKGTLQFDVSKRISNMSSHRLFKDINWNQIKNKQKIIMYVDKIAVHHSDDWIGINDQDYTIRNYPNKKINDWKYCDTSAM